VIIITIIIKITVTADVVTIAEKKVIQWRSYLKEATDDQLTGTFPAFYSVPVERHTSFLKISQSKMS
jgi:hypothetical protein